MVSQNYFQFCDYISSKGAKHEAAHLKESKNCYNEDINLWMYIKFLSNVFRIKLAIVAALTNPRNGRLK